MGVNQRSRIVMSPAEVDEFLRTERTASMCSLHRDGSIHAVAMWYGFLDGDVAFETKAKSQKVQNLRRDPRLTVMVEAGDRYEELRGVELVGRAEVLEDPDQVWAIGLSVYERYVGPFHDDAKPAVQAMLNKRVGVRLRADRVVSWDHRKLAAG
jgi:PPOX class probable F420-dependent enzyme